MVECESVIRGEHKLGLVEKLLSCCVCDKSPQKVSYYQGKTVEYKLKAKNLSYHSAREIFLDILKQDGFALRMTKKLSSVLLNRMDVHYNTLQKN